ncbi:MAG TPA: porin family protein [Flavobacteriales bacterium]
MPKNILLAAFMLTTLSVVNAQGPSFGLKGGLNFSSLDVESDDQKGRLGFNAGIFGRTDAEQPLGLQVELLYSTKGSSAEYTTFFGLVDQTVDFKLNYLELPVMLAFRPVEILDIHVGGYAGYLLSAQVETSGDLGSGSEDLDADHFQRIDAGLVVGAGLNLGPAQIGARYLYGLTELADSEEARAVLGNAKNACVQAYVAFGLGR